MAGHCYSLRPQQLCRRECQATWQPRWSTGGPEARQEDLSPGQEIFTLGRAEDTTKLRIRRLHMVFSRKSGRIISKYQRMNGLCLWPKNSIQRRPRAKLGGSAAAERTNRKSYISNVGKQIKFQPQQCQVWTSGSSNIHLLSLMKNLQHGSNTPLNTRNF